MIRRFLADKSGNYALLTGISMLPLMGALLIGVDYTEMSRQRQDTLNALDAAGIATARQITAGTTDDEARVYAQNFFSANLTAVAPQNVTLTYTPPSGSTGGGTLRLCATMKYHTYFLPATMFLMGKPDGSNEFNFSACSDVRLKNTLEVALVLDNSGSMEDPGKGSNKKRFDLLKDAAKQLVDQLAAQAQQVTQVPHPVQFSLVPFAASVNVGPDYYYDLQKQASWLDLQGISPIHHENFNWNTFPQTTTTTCSDSSGKCIQRTNGMIVARGDNWGTLKDKPLTRFTLFDQTKYTANDGTTPVVEKWAGCMEARPYPYNVDDTTPTASNPATLFVPMFAPDEAGEAWKINNNTTLNAYDAANSWWNDNTASNAGASSRLTNMTKYFQVRPSGKSTPDGKGPNYSCTTKPITPLTDVSTSAGATAVKKAIDDMEDGGATNVPEGMAWGWRTLSSAPPFTDGRPETERGNDKVVIVLTDGANTYYTPSSLGFSDSAGVKSTYSAEGYLKPPMSNGYNYGRMFLGTTSNVSKTDFSNANYTKAMNEHFATLCDNAKAKGIMVMTIALDLDAKKTADQAQMAALKACSSDSRSRRDPDDPTKPAKLFWNSTGASLSEDFRQIGNELSNLRIVS